MKKIKLLDCMENKETCKQPLKVINACYKASEQAVKDKDYKTALTKLKEAYIATGEIKDLPCGLCIDLFRSTIVTSIENLYDQLENLTTGWFPKMKYEPNRIEAAELLTDIFYKTI